MSVRAVTPYCDGDWLDYARDELATGEDIFDPEYLPPHKPHPLSPVSRHIPAGTPEPLLRSGTTSTGSSAATLTGAGAVEPSPRKSERPAGQSRASA